MSKFSTKDSKLPTNKTEEKNTISESNNANTVVKVVNNPSEIKPSRSEPQAKEAELTEPQQGSKIMAESVPFDVDRPKRLDPESFPDTKQVMGKAVPLSTLPNTEHMLTSYGISANYDVIAKDYVINISGLKSCPDNYDNTALTTLKSLAALNGILSGQLVEQVFAIASKNQKNPVMDMVLSKEWDGKNRLSEFCETIEEADDFPPTFKIELILKWLISCVAAASMPAGFSCRGVLTLQGAQSIGKTRWISRLISDKALSAKLIKLDVHMDASNKDSILLAVRHWIVEIGELDSSFKKDVARLKGFLTNDRDKIRLPYDRKESNYQRRTVFCATVNASDYLVDTTGNSRFWTIPCKSINYEHDIDMQQVWAQVYHEFQNNPNLSEWWLNPAQEEELARLNQHHSVVNAISDLLSSQLDFDAAPLMWRKMSASELLKDVGIDKPSNGQSRECGAFLREHCGEPRKVKGYMSWNVPPIKGSWSPFPKPAKKHNYDDAD